jgi:SAM-dependent methyltransferase
MSLETPAPTFRDPAGSLKLEGEFAVRSIHTASREAALEFVSSSFCMKLQLRGDMVGTTIDDSSEGLRLLHPRIAIPTYPWEWTPSQWLAAAELTVGLCSEAIDAGWILKDATPLNILFVGPKPILVDVLSFERWPNTVPGAKTTPIWLAYGQYIRTFLLPLLVNQVLSWPLQVSYFRRDGYEPAELYSAMSWGQRLSPSAFWPITLPALLERKQGEAVNSTPAARPLEPDAAAHVLKRALAGLRKRTRRALPKDAASNWSSYTTTLTHYTPEQAAAKLAWVQGMLEEHQPRRVLDIGANTGEYSALAASTGAEVVALERDAASADRLFNMARARGLNIQTIHADIARPTPSAGWENSEQTSLLARLEGQFQLVMMLAVIHHLILMEQIPVPAIMALMHRLTQRHLIVEWVPPTDPMYQSLMRGRDNLYGSLAEQDLLAACEGRFRVLKRNALTNGRVMFFFERL